MKNLVLVFYAQIRAQEWMPTRKEMRKHLFVPIESVTFEHKGFTNTFIEKGIGIRTSHN